LLGRQRCSDALLLESDHRTDGGRLAAQMGARWHRGRGAQPPSSRWLLGSISTSC